MRALAARPLGLAAATRGARASAAARVFASWRAPCRGAAGDAGSRAPRGASALSALLRRGFAAGAPPSPPRPSAAVRAATPSGFGSAPIAPARLAPDGTLPVGADTLVLGIETSCDDTGAAVVTGDGRVLGEALASQVEIHGPWGGVVPNLAREAHESAIDGVVARALADAGVHPSQLSAVAVTVGPGLSMCLRVGVVAAQNLCAAYDVPIVPVHHMEAHALVSRLAGGTDAVRFPFLALLVSGGHNQLILARGIGDYVILGSTLDDALGEAYDKTARLLGLDVGGGGGPALERLAREGDPSAYAFPVPLRKRKNCDFSYAGLKTAVRMAIERDLGTPEDGDAFTRVHVPGAEPPPSVTDRDRDSTVAGPDSEDPSRREVRADVAASFQRAAVRHLEERTRRAVEWAKDALTSSETSETSSLSCLVVAGGVAANATVRERLAAVAAEEGLPLVLPPPRWCTDNGVMVAWAGMERLALGLAEEAPTEAQVAEPAAEDGDGDDVGRAGGSRREVPLLPRWPLGERDARATGEVKSSKKANVAAPLERAGVGGSSASAPGGIVA